MGNYKPEDIYRTLKAAKDISTIYPDKSFKMCKDVYDFTKKNNLKLEEGYALVGMSLACRAESEINRMLDYSYNALEIFEVLQVPIGQVRSLNLIGIAYFYNSMYEEALKYLLQALNLLDECKDDFLLSCILNNIGEVFRESAKYEKALEYFYSALNICTDINSKINTASLLNNIGEIYFIENNYNEAFEYFTQSYNILIEEKDMIALGEVENKLGKVHYADGNYSKASEYLFRALKRLENIDNKYYSIDVLTNISNLLFKNDSTKSFYYLEIAIQYAKKTNAKKKLSQLYKTISNYYEKAGKYRDALEYFKMYHHIEQEIATTIVGNKLEILKIELDHLKENYEFEKVKIINKRLEVEISNQKKELDKIQKQNRILEKKLLEDELTGVPNRSYINCQLNKTREEALTSNKTIALFIIDIDNFKKYNDFWGHLKGDECLKRVAHCIRDIQVGRGDTFARYGGEEFIYYAIDINYNQALELGNLIRTEVEKLCIKSTSDNNSGVITISVGGILGVTSNFSNISDIIQIADKELYKAKNMGRNITSLKTLINY